MAEPREAKEAPLVLPSERSERAERATRVRRCEDCGYGGERKFPVLQLDSLRLRENKFIAGIALIYTCVKCKSTCMKCKICNKIKHSTPGVVSGFYSRYVNHLREKHIPEMSFKGTILIDGKTGAHIYMEDILSIFPQLALIKEEFKYINLIYEVNRRLKDENMRPIKGIGSLIFLGKAGQPEFEYLVDAVRLGQFSCYLCGDNNDSSNCMYETLPSEEVFLEHFMLHIRSEPRQLISRDF
jgi:ribosomal protein L44E